VSDFLPYGRQEIGEEDIAAVVAALRDPMITQGPRIDSFEAAFAEATGARHAVAFANGTAALHGAAAAAGLGPGDEVLTTPLSFVASSNCALFVGARPVFADVDARTSNLDLERALANGVGAGAKACVAVSLSGLPIDLEPLQERRRAGMVVIEDAAHALGGRRPAGPVGGDGLADMSVFSLHPVKAVTSGEGGVVTTEDDELADRLRTFRTHGIRRRSDPDDVLAGGWHYDIDSLGFNYRITDFQCALGESQLARLETFVAERNRVAAAYREALAGLEGIALPAEPPPGGLHAYHLFVVRFREGAARRRHVYDGLRAAGIGTQLHYIPIYRHGLYRGLGYGDEAARCPNAEAYYREALSLPMFPAMRDADVERVAAELARALAQPLP
jgi:UDP-4-amino-4,6-dideoxy-N-acetyl-beta-L-altrosamine transaminase